MSIPRWLENFEILKECIFIDADNRSPDQFYSPCYCKSIDGEDTCIGLTCLNYATQTECKIGKCSPKCKNNRFQMQNNVKLDVVEFPGKGYGLVATQDIKESTFLGEYVGEVVSESEISRRCIQNFGEKHMYTMQIKTGSYIDARKKGSIFRYINHSCEPNCYVEMWNVKGLIRVGVFAALDINAGTELCFDYKWKRSNKALTKCLCGSSLCRGYLELLTAEEIADNQRKKGLWRPKNECQLNDAEHIDPEWLVGKRVQIWWAGNQAFLEADVLEYDKLSMKHKVIYSIDESESSENLISEDSNWQWLDETKQPLSIKKKCISTDILSITTKSDISNEKSSTNEENNSYESEKSFNSAPEQFEAKIRKEFPISSNVIEFIVLQNLSKNGYNHNNLPNDKLVELLSMTLKRMYSVTAFIPRTKLNSDSINELVLFGTPKDISNAEKLFAETKNAYQATLIKKSSEELNSAKSKQSLIFTNDWRILHIDSIFPIYNLIKSGNKSDQVNANAHSYIFHKLLVNLETPGLSPLNDLISQLSSSMMSITGRQAAEKLNGVSPSIRKALIIHMRTMIDQNTSENHTSESELFTAIVLLQRCLSLVQDSDLIDSVGVLSAILILAAKANSNFKQKTLINIVKRVYCQVFSRPEDTISGSALESYKIKCLQYETFIFKILKNDVFVPNIPCLLFLHLKVKMAKYLKMLMISHKISLEEVKRPNDHSRTIFNMVEKLWGDSLIVLKAAIRFSLLSELHFPNILVCLPVEFHLPFLSLIFILINHLSKIKDAYDNLEDIDVATILPEELKIVVTMLISFLCEDPYKYNIYQVDYVVEVFINIFHEFPVEDLRHIMFNESINSFISLSNSKTILIKAVNSFYSVAIKEKNIYDDKISNYSANIEKLNCNGFDSELTATDSSVSKNAKRHRDDESNTMSHLELLDCLENEKSCDQHIIENHFDVNIRCKFKTRTPFRIQFEMIDPTSNVNGNNFPACELKNSYEFSRMFRDVWSTKIALDTINYINIKDFIPTQFVDDKECNVLIRHSPGIKQITKEIKTFNAIENDIDKSTTEMMGISYGAIKEITLLQAIHHDYGNGKQSHFGFNPYFILPISIVCIDGDKINMKEKKEKVNIKLSEGSFGHEYQASHDKSNHSNHESKFLYPQNSLYLVIPPESLKINLKAFIKLIASESAYINPFNIQLSSFAKELCRDLINALSYCTSIGIYFKWIQTEQLFITSDGKLIVSGFSGASYGSHLLIKSIENKSFQEHKSKMSKKSDDKQTSENHNKKLFSSSLISNLETSAPEIIAGSFTTYRSTIWSAAAVCCMILTGKAPIPSSQGKPVEKHMQRVFKLLGTPKLMGYYSYKNLPNAEILGSYIIEEGKKIDARERIDKSLNSILPESLKNSISNLPGCTNSNPITKFFISSLSLKPSSRKSFKLLLEHDIFSQKIDDHIREEIMKELVKKVQSQKGNI